MLDLGVVEGVEKKEEQHKENIYLHYFEEANFEKTMKYFAEFEWNKVLKVKISMIHNEMMIQVNNDRIDKCPQIFRYTGKE